MEYRFLGNSGLKVSVLSFGGWITQSGQAVEDTSLECIKAAFDGGINFFDTAEAYSAGESEKIMGKAFKKFGWARSDLVVSTKLYWGGKGINSTGLSRKHIVEGLNASLARLQLEYVDVVFAHRPDELTPMEETVRAFNYLIDQGKTFYWGTSEWSAEQISDAIRVAEKLHLVAPIVEQPQYNMFHRTRFEVEYAPLYKKWKLGTTIWSPLASGILTGKYIDNHIPADSRLAIKDNVVIERYRNSLATDEGKAKNEKVKKLKEYAEKKLGVSLAQLALAWCVKNPNVSTIILGASKVSQLQENIKSLELVPKLTPEVMKDVEDILANAPEHPPQRIYFN